jgi:hypothetical protein
MLAVPGTTSLACVISLTQAYFFLQLNEIHAFFSINIHSLTTAIKSHVTGLLEPAIADKHTVSSGLVDGSTHAGDNIQSFRGLAQPADMKKRCCVRLPRKGTYTYGNKVMAI